MTTLKLLAATFAAAVCLLAAPGAQAQSALPDGSDSHPLRVLLIPADGGTETGTKADYAPVFNAITRSTGLHFDLKVGQSYSAVVEGMCNRVADIAFFGPVSYIQAHQRGCAQLLAVGVQHGQSIYYAGMFAKADAPIASVRDLRGKRVAFGDVNSTSSFTYQIAMLLDAGLDPIKDLGALRMTGSHANSLAALVQGQVDVASLSFESFDKAVQQGAVDPKTIKVVAKSDPIPYPPLAMNSALPDALKAELKQAFANVDHAPGVTRDMLRGYGGERIDAYNTNFTDAEFATAGNKMARVTDALKGEILRKASQR
jgi:phosphonate transport system substrate-binding protein